MGSPEFAVPSLERVARAHDVAMVVTQPDKPAGRGRQLTAPPVKRLAVALGLPVRSPTSVRSGEFADELRQTGADIGVVVAYGKILPDAVLEAFPRGCVNVHGSILPQFRGAAPVQRAVMDGLAETGVSIMQLDQGMDTGPVYATRVLPIGPDETAGELMARLAPLGAELLENVLEALTSGTAVPVAQDNARATYAPMLQRSDGYIDFGQPATRVAARIRGVDPWPGATVLCRGERIKLFGARVQPVGASAARGGPGRPSPGEILAIGDLGALVATADESVWIREALIPGRRRMAVAQLAVGRAMGVGDVLSTPVDVAEIRGDAE